MNVSSAREDSPLIESISNTLRLVFGHVYRLRIPESFENLLVASGRRIDFAFPVGAVATELRASHSTAGNPLGRALMTAGTNH